MDNTKFGIIGYGSIGKRHHQRIDETEGAELVAICDIKEDRFADNTNENIFKTTNYQEILDNKDVEVVCVTSPNGLHYQMTIDALKKGKHVVCEKPMALSVLNCNEMIMTAQRTNQKLFVVKQNRFNPPIVKLKELIEKGELGKIFMVTVNCFWNRNENYYNDSDWKGTLDLDGGTLFTQFSHFIDLLYYLFGDVISVNAQGRNYDHSMIDFEDTGVINFELANEAIGTFNYTTCSFEQNMEGSITVFAENGSIKIAGQYLNVLDYYKIKDVVIEELEPGNPSNDYGFYRGSMSNHDKVIKNVVRTLRGEDVIATSAFEGMKTVQIIEACYESMKINKKIYIR
ncbi:MAG: gfo/Idh/MocA family oxidoreductase [Calditrichaeota bacterium]|nr:MAG: gfo/Idh/MocA family oxidoreductase [Calditrichota bacterium]